MRIDPKYFPRFMFFVAAISFVAIAWSTIAYQERRLTRFEEALPSRLQEISLDSLSRFEVGIPRPLSQLENNQDTQQVKHQDTQQYTHLDSQRDTNRNQVPPLNYPLTLVFWAPWSDESINILQQESRDSTTSLVALSVKDSRENVVSVLEDVTMERSVKNFRSYDGTPLYQAWELPGVPTVVHMESPSTGVFVVGTKRDSIAFSLQKALSL
ncbi:MAG: hypothetical protein RI513_02710 [Balneolaceae bacterium]|nr:hypothetical protein [Balneolaceae bacterium]